MFSVTIAFRGPSSTLLALFNREIPALHKSSVSQSQATRADEENPTSASRYTLHRSQYVLTGSATRDHAAGCFRAAFSTGKFAKQRTLSSAMSTCVKKMTCFKSVHKLLWTHICSNTICIMIAYVVLSGDKIVGDAVINSQQYLSREQNTNK